MEWSTLFGLGVRVGIMVCLLAWLLWDLLIDTAVLSEQADLGDLFLMISAIRTYDLGDLFLMISA